MTRFRRLVSWTGVIAVIASFAFHAGIGMAAARLTDLTDAITTHQVSTGSDHGVSFTTPTGVESSSDTITLDFSSFSLASITVSDIDLSHGPTTGQETVETLAASAAVNVWGVSISGTTITFTAPTNAAVGEIAANDRVSIVIGQSAVGGTNRIINPGTEGDYQLIIAGTFDDQGRIGLAVGNDVVNVSATVPSTSTPSTPGGGGGGSQPPMIFNVQASTTSYTSFLVTWQTDEFSNSYVDYGHDNTYASGTMSDLTFVSNHSVSVPGVIPCKTYHFRVRSTDADGNTGTSGDYSVTMPCDTTAPVITNVQAVNITDTGAVITWNTNESADSYVEYGLTSAYGATGSVAGFVTGHAVPISGLSPGTVYHYRVISADPWGNRAVSGDLLFLTTSDTTPPANVQLNAAPGNTQVQLTWTNPSDPDFSGVRLVRKTGGYPTGPNDGIVIYQGPGMSFLDTGLTNGVTYYYGAYSYDTNGNLSSGALASATPSAVTQPPEPDEPPVTFPPGTVPPGPGVTSTPPMPGVTMLLQFFGSEGSLPLAFGQDGTIGVLAGSRIIVRVPADSLNGNPTLVAFMINNSRYALTYDDDLNAYVGSFTAPASVGLFGGMGQVLFDDGRSGAVGVVLRTQNAGRVYERSLIGGVETPVENAKVRLFRFDAEAVPWNGGAYGQSNPIYTDAQGRYVFQVPPGRYYVQVEKEGFWTYFSPPIFVDGNVFAVPVELIRKPLTPEEVISPTSTPAENAVAVARSVADQIAAGLKLLRQFLNTPAVRDAVVGVITPLALTVTLINAASAVSLFNALAYLQYLFTEPLFLLGRRRRRWGVVYNAYTKVPLDLAIVRLIHAPSGLTVRTRVTDSQGRFYFVVEPGQYRVEAVKPGYTFPSQYAKGNISDADFGKLYLGERMMFDQRSTIMLNIPMDPLVPSETTRQALLYATLHQLQHLVATSGVVLSGIVLVLFPAWPILGIFLIHLCLFILFRRLHGSHRSSSWGTVSDRNNRKPVPRAVVRLFESKYNRLLETQVTDRSGRYGFLAGKNSYYLTAEAKGYQDERVEADLTNKKGDLSVTKNIALERNARRKRSEGKIDKGNI